MSTDFETQLRDRFADATADVTATDDLFDRAEVRYATHTRRRRVLGGLVAAALVAFGALAVPSLLDRLDASPAPIVDDPEVQRPSEGPDPEHTNVPAPSGQPTLRVAHDGLLDELGVADDSSARDLPVLVAFDAPPHGTVVLQGERAPLAPNAFCNRCGQIVRLIAPDGSTRVLLRRADDANELKLHGLHLDGPGWALVEELSNEGSDVFALALDGDGEVDADDPYGGARTVDNFMVDHRVLQVSIVSPADRQEPLVVVAAEWQHRRLDLLTYDGIGGPRVESEVDWLADRCEGCDVTTFVGRGGLVAYVELRGGTDAFINVGDANDGRSVDSLPLPEGADPMSVTLELDGEHLLINARPDARWIYDFTAQQLDEVMQVPQGFATFARSPGDADEADGDPRDRLDAAGSVGTWGEVPAPRRGWTTWPEFGDPVWVGGHAYVVVSWAGGGGARSQTVLIAFDPTTESWTEHGPLPTYGEIHAAGDRLVLLVDDRRDIETGAPWRTYTFEPGAGSWTEQPDAPLASREPWLGHSVTWTGDELIVWGGAREWYDEEVGNRRVETYADGAAFEPDTGTWRELASSPLAPRGDHGTVWNGRRLVVFGGGHADAYESEFWWTEHRDDAAVYDPATDRWSTIQSPGRIGPVVAADWTGTHVLIWSGRPDQTNVPFGWVWDPVSGDAVEIPEDLPARETFNYRDDIDHQWAPEIGRWILWGGGCGEGCNASFAHGYLLDPDTLTWELLSDPDDGTGFGSTAVWLGDRLLVVGGDDGRYQNHQETRAAVPRVWLPPGR